jgi:hypothetical protein
MFPLNKINASDKMLKQVMPSQQRSYSRIIHIMLPGLDDERMLTHAAQYHFTLMIMTTTTTTTTTTATATMIMLHSADVRTATSETRGQPAPLQAHIVQHHNCQRSGV